MRKEEFLQNENGYWDQDAERILSHLGLAWDDLKNKRVLDLGAGLAAVARAAQRRGIHVVSVDSNPGQWSANLPRQGVSKDALMTGIDYQIADASSLPFNDDSFDLVIAHAGPGLTTDPEEFQIIANEALRVGKRFVIGSGSTMLPLCIAFTGCDVLAAASLLPEVREKTLQRIRELFPKVTYHEEEVNGSFHICIEKTGTAPKKNLS